jgi:hypothetical protein
MINYFYKLKLENGSEFTVEKELGDYLHQLEQTVRELKNHTVVAVDW